MKPRFRWDLFCVFAAVFLALSAAAAYLAAITLPSAIEGSVTRDIESATGKKVLIRSMRFDLLKGLVLDGPVLYDNAAVVIRAKEAHSGFLIPPIFKKKIIIPRIFIESPSILIERKADNLFNITELIPHDYVSKSGMDVAIYGIVVKRAAINFIDKTLNPEFTKKIEKADIDINLLFPDKVSLNISCTIPSRIPAKVKSHGEYNIAKKEASARITVEDFSPEEFIDYYRAPGVTFPEGLLDAAVDLRIREGVIRADIATTTKRLVVSKDKIKAALGSRLKAAMEYDTAGKQLKYSGKLYIDFMNVAGIDAVGQLENVKAVVEFDESRLAASNIKADAFGIPWNARINLINFQNPLFDIYASSQTRLSVLQKILIDNFKIKLPADIAGECKLDIAVQAAPGQPPRLNGYVGMGDATISLGESNFPIEHLNGEARFTFNDLTWSGLDLTYRGKHYKSSGTITNFASAGVRLEAVSDDLSFKSIFAVNDKLINLTQLDGRYYGSEFSAKGTVDLRDPKKIKADISGKIAFELKDLKDIVKPSEEIPKAKPSGTLSTEFTLKGDIKDIKQCAISAKSKSDRVSFYGMELDGLLLDYTQSEGSGSIKSVTALFYDGLLSSSGRIDWVPKEPLYSFTLNILGAKLEKYKKGTEMKDKDLAGDVKLYASLNGSFKDISTLKGLGKISIEKGKLWKLDLFKGLGTFIFTSDFSDIVFAEGSCNFKIKDKAFYTNDISLKSDLLNLYGSGTLGFDKSIYAVLTPEIAEGSMYPGFQKNVATAVGKGTLVEVSGTLKDPKYKTTTDVSALMGGMANVFLQQ